MSILKKILTFTLSSIAFGGTIDRILDNIVLGSYTASPRIIQSTRYTTFAGPSVSFRLRTDLMNKPPFYFQPPRATLSCAGLDFDAGWLSIMNLDTLAQMLQQAGASFMWGVAVGLVYSLPGVAQAFDMLQKWGRYAQFLGQGACQAGIIAGRNLFNAFKEGIKTESINEAISQGITSTLTQAVKEYKKNIDIRKAFGIYPYEIYYNSSSDKDFGDLLASVTGVYIFYPVDSSGNICNSQDCYDNIKANILPPLAEVSVRELIEGANKQVEVYDCLWGVLSNGIMFCTNASQGSLPTRKISFNKGLKDIELDYLNRIFNTIESGGTLTPADRDYLLHSPIQNLGGILNTLATYKRMGNDAIVNQALYELAYISAVLKLQALIKSMLYAYNSYKYAYANEKNVPENFFTQIKTLEDMEKEIDNYVSKVMDKVIKLNKTFEVFEKQRRYIAEKIMEEFGLGFVIGR
ncbi:MAG: hypothetical protein DSY32_02365 [Aquifex sp.]|nr:MAG: hypothetical protein DSY32_02365 [Aquifex sp.]